MTIRRTKTKRRPHQRRNKGQGVSPPSRNMAQAEKYEWKMSDVESLRELHAQRSYVAQKTDEHLIAPIAPTPSHWIKYPGEYDVYGVDYPEWRAKNQMEKRSETAQSTDLAKKAPLAPTPEEWAKHPDKYDLPGVDTKQKKQAKKTRVDEPKNPMGTPESAKKYLGDVVQVYRKKLGVKGEVKLHARNRGTPAQIVHSQDGKAPQVEVNYRHFGMAWERDPQLTKRYLEYAVAHEMAHQKQIEELGYTGLLKASKAAKSEVESDADLRAWKAMGVSEAEFKKVMGDLAKRAGAEHVRSHPPFRGKPDISRFKDHTPPEKPQKAEKPKGMAAPPAARWYGVDLNELKRVPGIGDKIIESLRRAGYRDVGQVWSDSCSGWKKLEAIDGIGEETAKNLFKHIGEHVPPKKAEEPAPKKRSIEEIRGQMKVTYGKVLSKAIPSATQHEKELIAEKAIAEEWVKASDTAKTAEARVTEKARVELVKIRQEKATKDREEQLKHLKDRADQAQAKKTDEDRAQHKMALAREGYAVQYSMHLDGTMSQYAASKRAELYKALLAKGYSKEEAAEMSRSFNEDAVRSIQAEELKQAKADLIALADDKFGRVPDLWEDATRKNVPASLAQGVAMGAVDAAYEKALGAVRDRTEPPKPVMPIVPQKPTVKTSSESYDFYADPGHGWLRVPVKRLEELGIANDISPYSYVKGDYAYLEEDRDARIFTDTLAGLGVDVKLKDHTSNRDSSIRRYQPYRGPAYKRNVDAILAAQTHEALGKLEKAIYQDKALDEEEKKQLAEYIRARSGNIPDAKAAAAKSPGEEAPAPTVKPEPTVRSRVAALNINEANALIREHIKAHCPTVSIQKGRGTAGGWLDIQGSGEYGRFTDQERQQLAVIGLQVGNTNSYPMDFDEKASYIERRGLLDKPVKPQDDLPSLKKATAFSPEYGKDSGMYEVEVYDPDKREKTTRRFSTPDKAEQYRRLINENPGWPMESFKERQGLKQGAPKYIILARNAKSQGKEALRYTVYDRDKSDRRGQNEVARGTIEYTGDAPSRERIMEDLIKASPKGTSYEVEFTMTPHWTPALSMVERIAPASPTGTRDGKWMVWFTNRIGRDMDPREGIGTRSFNTYEEALEFAREGRGLYNQGDFEREGLWLTVPDPPTLPSELESFTGKKDRFEVDPRPEYEGVWNPDTRKPDYRWAFKNKAGGNTHTLDQLKEEHQKGEWRRRDRAEAAKSSRAITKEKHASRKSWDWKAQPLASAVVFNDAARIEAEGDTVTMMGMNGDHTALIKLRLPNDLGIPEGKYEVEYSHLDNRVTHLNHPEKVRWDNVERSLKVSKKDQESYINYEKVTEYKSELPEPKVPFKVKAKVDLEALERAASQKGIEHLAIKVSDGLSPTHRSITYEATKWETRKLPPDEENAYEREDRVEVQVSGAIGEVKTTDEDEVKAVYTASYLSANLGALIKAGFRDATLEYSTDMPVKIAARRDDGAEAEFWLAPCIGV